VTAPRKGDPATGPTRDGALCGSPKRGRPGETCRNPAGKGTNHLGHGHCRFHGGNSPHGEAMATREAAYDLARTMHLPVDDADPDLLLLALVREQAGVVAWLREQVQALDAALLVRSARFGRRVETNAGQFPGVTTITETASFEHVLSQMYARERRIYADLLVKVAGLGIAKRHVELAREQGELAGRMLVAVLSELDVDPASPRAREVIRRQFTLIAGEADG
jgi:hypothetical protein